MNRVAPIFNRADTIKMDSIAVRPVTPVASSIPSMKSPRQSFAENFKLFGKIPVNMRKSEVMRRDSLFPKTLRFLNSNEYTTYDTIYSKSVIVLAVINAVLLLTFFIFFAIYYSKHGAVSVYVKKELITDEFKEKNKELDTMNTVSFVNTIIGATIGSLTFLATVLQFRYVFKKNDFR